MIQQRNKLKLRGRMNAFSRYFVEYVLCVRLFLAAQDSAVNEIVEVLAFMELRG